VKSPKEMNIIQIEITNACSLSCSNCTRFCGHHEEPFFMDFDTFKNAVDSMNGFKGTVGIMGGEPTLHPEFERFSDYFRENFGAGKVQNEFKTPTKDFVKYIVDNAFNYEDPKHTKRGLWSSVGRNYYKHFEVIQKTYSYQALNDHINPSFHQTLMLTRKELGIPDKEWYRLRDNCWIQKYWSASISPKGAFFCEVAAALDYLFKGPGGWKIEKGWWEREPKDFGSQLEWCEYCSACLPAPKRDARQETDDMSPEWAKRLQEVNSPKFKKGKYQIFDVDGYDVCEHEVIDEALPYMHDQSLRISESNKNLFPRSIIEVNGLCEISANGLGDDWVFITDGKVVRDGASKILKNYVFNSGYLYRCFKEGYLFFNVKASALRGLSQASIIADAFGTNTISWLEYLSADDRIVGEYVPQLDSSVLKGRKQVPIVTALDDNYAPYFGACLASIVANSSETYFYDIVILADNISLENQNKLCHIISVNNNFSLRFFEGNIGFEKKDAVHGHFAKSTFFRLKMGSLMPSYPKVVYIDPDTIVLRDLSELYNTDLDEAYVAASVDLTYKLMIKNGSRVPEYFGGLRYNEYLSSIGLDAAAMGGYFNAGVMVFNLEKLRSAGLETKMIELYEQKEFNAVDQDILNILFSGRVKYISEQWNFIVQPDFIMKDCESVDYGLYKKSAQEPFIIHYAGSHLKPWKGTVLNGEYFWNYLKETLFYDAIRQDHEERFESWRNNIVGFRELERARNIAIFGLGVSGKLTLAFILKNMNCNVSYIIDDNALDEYEGIKVVSSDEFLFKCFNEVDLVVFGKYQKVNPKILECGKLAVRLENVV